jgi:3'-phosphoadenosine 5'-phosphosulfate sulfotransferase (PAPS reductase)/FAD synthetase
MKHFLSFGGGVNSVAYYLYLIEKGIEFEAVFSNHGADHPDTYKYMEYFNKEVVKRGWKPVTIIEGKVQEKTMDKPMNLFDYCLLKNVVPSRMLRWCTEKFKIVPTNLYMNSQLEGGEEEKCYMHMGIAYDEAHRAKPPKNPPKYLANKIYQYWFIDDGITRADNIEIIKRHGFKVPRKSGCYFCPYAKKKDFIELYRNDPCLYEKAKLLEHNVNEQRLAKGKAPLYISAKPIEVVVGEGQVEMFFDDDGELDHFGERERPCNCGL